MCEEPLRPIRSNVIKQDTLFIPLEEWNKRNTSKKNQEKTNKQNPKVSENKNVNRPPNAH